MGSSEIWNDQVSPRYMKYLRKVSEYFPNFMKVFYSKILYCKISITWMLLYYLKWLQKQCFIEKTNLHFPNFAQTNRILTLLIWKYNIRTIRVIKNRTNPYSLISEISIIFLQKFKNIRKTNTC